MTRGRRTTRMTARSLTKNTGRTFTPTGHCRPPRGPRTRLPTPTRAGASPRLMPRRRRPTRTPTRAGADGAAARTTLWRPGPNRAPWPRPPQALAQAAGRRRGRHGVPRPSRPAEDPLTSESFSRHAREATDSRSYRGSRAAGDPNRPPSRGRPDPVGCRHPGHAPGPARLRPGSAVRPEPAVAPAPSRWPGGTRQRWRSTRRRPAAVPGGPGNGYPGPPPRPWWPRQRLSGRPGQRPATGRTP